MELENQGGGGTALNHWEKRILGVRTSTMHTCVWITFLSYPLFPSFPPFSLSLSCLPSLLQNEAMTGQFTFNPVFSRITFAALEDSG